MAVSSTGGAQSTPHVGRHRPKSAFSVPKTSSWGGTRGGWSGVWPYSSAPSPTLAPNKKVHQAAYRRKGGNNLGIYSRIDMHHLVTCCMVRREVIGILGWNPFSRGLLMDSQCHKPYTWDMGSALAGSHICVAEGMVKHWRAASQLRHSTHD